MAIDISELTVVMINIDNYFKEPYVQKAFQHNLKLLKGAKIEIITEKNFKEFCKFNRAKYNSPNIKIQRKTNELRLYLNRFFKYPLYIDSDVLIDEQSIKTILQNPQKDFIGPGGTYLSYFPNENSEFLNILRNLYSTHSSSKQQETFSDYCLVTEAIPIYKKPIDYLYAAHLNFSYIRYFKKGIVIVKNEVPTSFEKTKLYFFLENDKYIEDYNSRLIVSSKEEAIYCLKLIAFETKKTFEIV